MRVLVSGGAGFIGSHIVEGLVSGGHEVGVLDNLSTGRRENLPQAARLFQVDLRDREGTFAALREFRPTHVSHQAAQASVAVSVRDPRLDAEINILGGVNLLDACRDAAVSKVIFASTGGAIYGEVADGTRASESHQPAPQSPYAISKYGFELLLDAYQRYHGLDYAVLRYANVYGPRQDPFGEAGVVAVFCDTALKGGTLRVNGRRTHGDAGCVRDYVFVRDVARANLAALEGKLPTRVLNIASGTATTTRELAELVVKLANPKATLEASAPRAGDLERSVLDPTRSREVIGDPTSLEIGLAATLDHYRRTA